jgi:excisionase family DNA binding protein
MAATAHSLEDLLDQRIAVAVERAVAPLRQELERLRSSNDSAVTIPEAARRLEVTTRAVQRWIRDGRLELAPPAGGVRMVIWPPRAPPR